MACLVIVILTEAKDSIRWLYSCDKSPYIRSVYSQCNAQLLKYTEQNVNKSHNFMFMFSVVLR